MRTTEPSSLKTFSARGCNSKSTGWARHQASSLEPLQDKRVTLAHEMNCQAPIACPSSWCPTRKLGYSWKRCLLVLRRWSWPLRHAPQPLCVEAGAELASKACTTSSSQLQMVKNSGNHTTTSLLSLSTNSTWMWASPERCHQDKHVCALR